MNVCHKQQQPELQGTRGAEILFKQGYGSRSHNNSDRRPTPAYRMVGPSATRIAILGVLH